MNAPNTPCHGPLRRREFLRLGLTGLAGLTWPGLLRLRAEAARASRGRGRALLVVWLHGGASHLETYDPKPDAPAEYRGPFRPIATRVPRHAGVASCCRGTPASPTASPCCGRWPTPARATTAGRSSCSPASRSRSTGSSPTTPTCSPSWTASAPTRRGRCPTTSACRPIPYLGSAYLGPAHEPFAVHGDPNDPELRGAQHRPEGRPAQVARLGGRVRPARRASTGSAGGPTTWRKRDGLRRLPAARR